MYFLRTWQPVWMILEACTFNLKRDLRWLLYLWRLPILSQIMWTWSPHWKRYDVGFLVAFSPLFHLHPCIFILCSFWGVLSLGSGHPAGKLNFQQEIMGLPLRSLQCCQRCCHSLQQPLPRARHRQRSGLSHCVSQPAHPSGTDRCWSSFCSSSLNTLNS